MKKIGHIQSVNHDDSNPKSTFPTRESVPDNLSLDPLRNLTIRPLSQQERMDEAVTKYVRDIESLNNFTSQLLSKTSYEDLFEFIGYKFYDLVKPAIVLVNEYFPQTDTTTLKFIKGPKEDLQKLEKVFQGKPHLDLAFKLEERLKSRMHLEKIIKIKGGLHELSSQPMPKVLSEKLEKALEIREIYLAPFVLDKDILGMIIILTKEKQKEVNGGMIETLLNLSTGALKRKRTEEELRESEARFRAIFNDAALGITLADMQGHPVEVNSAFEKMVGFAKEELKTITFLDFTYPDDRLLDVEQFEKMKKGALDSYSLEKRYVRKDGQIIWVHVGVSLLRSQEGHPQFTIGIIREITKSKKTEQELARVASFPTLNPMPIVEVNDKGKITYANPSAQRRFPDLEKKQALHPFVAKIWRQCRQQKGTEKKPFIREIQVDSSWYLQTAYLSPNNSYIRVYSFDISEKKAAEEDLKRSEQRYQLAQKAANIGSWDWDILTNKLTWSETVEPLFGFKKGKFPGTYESFLDSVHPEDRQKVIHGVEACVKKGEEYDLEHRILWPDKSIHWVSEKGDVVRKNGKAIRMLGVVQDITVKKANEERLARSEERFRMIFAESPIGIELYNSQGFLVEANQSCLDIFGIKDISQVKEFNLFKDPHLTEETKQRLLLGEIIKVEIPFDFTKIKEVNLYETTKSGIIDLEVAITPLKAHQTKELFGYLVQIHDITERKALEQRKDEFISIASHELKTPLTSIKAFTQLLEKYFQNKNDDHSIYLLSRMHAQVNKLTELINELLDVTKIQSGKLKMEKGHYALDKLIEEVAQDVQTAFGAKHAFKVKTNQTPKVYIDRYRIGQALTNLLVNAIKYSPQADKVIINTKVDKKDIIISVQDFGIGIPKENQQNIFERFYSIEKKKEGASKIPELGLGLGLYITSEIIKRHHGKIWVKSQVGKGSTFFFSLPLITKKFRNG